MKAHLIDSETPLIEGQNYHVLCGAHVKHSRFIYWFDIGEAPEFLSALSSVNICARCFRCQIEQRYVYGLVPGQQALTESEEMEEMAA